MKFILVFATLLGLSFGKNVPTQNLVGFDNKLLVNQLLKALKAFDAPGKQDTGNITANIDEFADKLMINVAEWAVNNGFDPIPLQNISQNFLTAYVDLWDGHLYGISTINRTGDIMVTYSHSLKKLFVTLPLVFDDLQFSYWYHVVLLLIGPSGKMTGTIDDFKAYIELSFDFNEYHVAIDKINTWGMGEIHVHFEDDGIIDVVANILSQLVVDVLHPIIEALINSVIHNVSDKVVEEINKQIDDILHPNTTAFISKY